MAGSRLACCDARVSSSSCTRWSRALRWAAKFMSSRLRGPASAVCDFTVAASSSKSRLESERKQNRDDGAVFNNMMWVLETNA
jgi:hypothetical protein